MDSQELTLGYWNIRGLAGIVRSVLSYCEVPYKERIYSIDNPDEWSKKDKQELGLLFPNLPYIIDGDTKLTESKALVEYAVIRAGRRDLLGETDKKYIEIQVAWGAIYNLRFHLMTICATKGDFEAEKEQTFANGMAKTFLPRLDNLLIDKEWVCETISIADFELFETVELIHDIDSKKLEPFSNLSKFYDKFQQIPQIKAHRQSDTFFKTWFLPTLAWSIGPNE